MAKRTDENLTPKERERLAELLRYTTESTALEILALERGEWPGLYLDRKPEPWPAQPAQEPEP